MSQRRLRSAAIALTFVATAAPAEERVWVDLTHPLSSESVFWPTARPFRLTTDAEGMTEAGYYYSAFSFSGAEHGGTHIDAPVHFAEGRRSVDEIPLSQLMGPAVVIDVSTAAAENRDHRVSVSEIAAWETTHGRIPDDAIVLFRTGYDRHWPDAEAYLGTALKGEAGVAALHFPGLHPEAAAWLVSERRVKAVGIDTASIDYGQSARYQSHVALMTANVPAFENVTNLDRLPATGTWVIALPAKIEGGSGGPLRIIARLPER